MSDKQLCSLLCDRLQRGKPTTEVCTVCADATQLNAEGQVVVGECVCARDVSVEEALRDPWEYFDAAAASGGAGAGGSVAAAAGSAADNAKKEGGAAGGGARAASSSAVQQDKRAVYDSGWRCMFIEVGGTGAKNRCALRWQRASDGCSLQSRGVAGCVRAAAFRC
jgi:hypothetical protein